MSEPVDEVHQALSNAVRTAAMAAGQVAEIIAARRAETYRRAAHASQTEARHTAARLRAERQAATPVTRAPSFLRALRGCSLLGLGGSRGDGLAWSLVEGLYDTTAPGSRGAADRQQGDAP